MDIGELVKRFRSLKAQLNDGDQALLQLVAAIENDETELHEAFRLLAPFALKALDRDTLRLVPMGDPPIPVGNTGKRLPLMDFRRPEMQIAMAYFTKVERTARQVKNAFSQAFQLMDATVCLREVWSQLTPDTQKVLARFGGMKRLAA